MIQICMYTIHTHMYLHIFVYTCTTTRTINNKSKGTSSQHQRFVPFQSSDFQSNWPFQIKVNGMNGYGDPRILSQASDFLVVAKSVTNARVRSLRDHPLGALMSTAGRWAQPVAGFYVFDITCIVIYIWTYITISHFIVYIYTHTDKYNIYTCIHIICVLHTLPIIHVYECICTCACLCVFVYVFLYMCMFMFVFMCVYEYVYVFFFYIYLCLCRSRCRCLWNQVKGVAKTNELSEIGS